MNTQVDTVFHHIPSTRPVSQSDICEATGISKDAVNRAIRELSRSGVVEMTEGGRRINTRRYISKQMDAFS